MHNLVSLKLLLIWGLIVYEIPELLSMWWIDPQTFFSFLPTSPYTVGKGAK